MRIDNRYQLHTVADEQILLLQGQVGGEMTRVIAFNPTAVMLWEQFHDQEFDTDQVVQHLLAHFDVGPEQARRDALLWVETLKRYGVIQ